MKRLISLILVLILLFSLGISASAAEPRIEAKSLFYRGISIYVNGAELVPQDVNGNATEPFIIEGTTYLPVRALAGALGLSVGWDGDTNTITLTSGAEKNMGSGEAAKTKQILSADVYYKDVKIFLDGAELIPTDVNGNVVEPFLMGGSTYLPLRAIATALGLNVAWDEITNTITLNSPEAPTGMVWRLVKQTVTTSAQAESLVMETEFLYNEVGRFLGMVMSLDEFRVVDIQLTYTLTGLPESLYMLTEDQYLVINFEYKPGSDKVHKLSAELNGEFVAASVFLYDSEGRVISECPLDAEGNMGTLISHSYDENGNCIYTSGRKIDDYANHSTIARTFDEEGRLLTEEGRVQICEEEKCKVLTIYELSYSYDENGNVLSHSYRSAETSYNYEYEYDALGREVKCRGYVDGEHVTTVTVWAQDGLSCTVTTTSAGLSSTETRCYSEDGRLLRSVAESSGTTVTTEYEYALYPFCGEDQIVIDIFTTLGYNK